MASPTPSEQDWFEFLSDCWPFSSLPAVIVEILAARMELRRYPAGEHLMREGEPGDSLMVVVDGLVEVSATGEAGERRVIGHCGYREVIGEMALVTREPRTADVRALRAVEVLALSADDFHRLVARHPVVSVVLTELLSERLGRSDWDALGGKTLGGYRLLAPLGRGGMAVVYEAEEAVTGRHVALKMLSHRFVYDRDALARFQREADLIQSLEHPNIVRLHGRFPAYATYFLVMELCRGASLAEIIRHHAPLPHEEARRILGQLACALAHAHERGIIHRDVKPGNVIVTTGGTVKLMDFGVAKPVEGAPLTQSGCVLGTPAYMPPEQLQGQPVSPAADLYALGCVAFEMLTGRRLFETRNLFRLIHEKALGAAARCEGLPPDLPQDLRAVLEGSLATQPADRTLDLAVLAAGAAPAGPSLLEFPPEGEGGGAGEDSTLPFEGS